jgi:hypothetical protein
LYNIASATNFPKIDEINELGQKLEKKYIQIKDSNEENPEELKDSINTILSSIKDIAVELKEYVQIQSNANSESEKKQTSTPVDVPQEDSPTSSDTQPSDSSSGDSSKSSDDGALPEMYDASQSDKNVSS